MKPFESIPSVATMEDICLSTKDKIPVQKNFPLHPAQKEVFRAQLIDVEAPYYNVGAYVKLKGHLNKDIFLKAVRSAPEVFDAFKMRFHVADAEVFCVFDEAFEKMEVAELDLSNASDPANDALTWMQRCFNTAFVIKKDKKLFQNVLIKIGEDEHWFFMRYHHLIMDGYGFKVWLQYLSKKYSLSISGKGATMLYPTYLAEIEKANRHSSSLFYTLESLYWKERIAEKPKKLLQRKPSHRAYLKASTFQYSLTENERKWLMELQSSTGNSLQQLTLAALFIYFGKTTGLSQFIFGILLHQRESKEGRNVVGMFSSVLPFKGNFEPTTRLSTFLKELKIAQKKDYRHKNYLSGEVSRQLHINPSEENLFDIVVNHELLHFDLNFCNDITATVHQLCSEKELTPLQICWQEFGSPQPLQLQMIFREDYFNQQEIVQLTQRLLYIMEQFPLHLENEIGGIDIIPGEEKMLLEAFNNTDVNYSREASLINLFEQQVEKTPDRVAVVCEEKKLTYQQLNEKANQLAHFLLNKEVKEGDLIPIYVSRSLEMMIGLIAVLKCGATYVPIDAAYPTARVVHILEEIKSKIIITQVDNQSNLPHINNLDQVIIDKDLSFIKEQPLTNLNINISPSSLIYLIYTSGSTGKPKGVQMQGTSLLNLLMWQEEQFGNAFRHVLQFASLNFDVSFQEIFSTLCFGHSLFLIKEEQRTDVHALSSAIERFHITHLFLPSIFLKSLAEFLSSNNIHLPRLKKIIVAGEQLQLTNDINQLLSSSGITLINQYGPTETHVVSSYTIDQQHISPQLPPIGKPISNNCIYIVDDQLALLPPGVSGEICIAGAGVSNGYYANEKLTAEKFVSNPYGKGKMYRTGDIGRWLQDGNIEFLGRKDDQVKIRGYRVEIGEIEAVLLQSSFVKQCVVIAKENMAGAKQLVCYVVPKGPFDKKKIIAYLKSILPEYMVPALYIPLQTLPITANGKVDKKALPAFNNVMTENYKAPKTVLENILVKIWKEVLGVEQVSIQDNFFELGGHSLLVIKMIGKLKQQTGRTLSPGSLFQHPTIESYAKFLLEKQPVEYHSSIVLIKGGENKLPLYIICHIGVAPIGRFIPFAGLLNKDQPVYGIQMLDTDKLDSDSIKVEDIASKYVADLITHNPTGPYAFAGYSLGGLIAVEMAKQLKAMEKKVVLLCLFDTVAYPLKTPTINNAIHRGANNPMPLISKISYVTGAMVNRMDTLFYLVRFNIINGLRRRKNALILKFKKMCKVDVSLEQNIETKLLGEELHKVSIAAYKKYKLTPYDGTITLFRAKKQTFYFGDPKHLGWKPYADSVKVYEAEGSHYTMFNPSYCRPMAKLLQQCLDNCNAFSDEGKQANESL